MYSTQCNVSAHLYLYYSHCSNPLNKSKWSDLSCTEYNSLILQSPPSVTFSASNNSNILDGCYHVYLDVGSNIGVQVRKLYQPAYYPGAGVLKVFQEAFGE